MSAIKLNFFILILFFTAGSLVYMGVSKPTVFTPAEYSLFWGSLASGLFFLVAFTKETIRAKLYYLATGAIIFLISLAWTLITML